MGDKGKKDQNKRLKQKAKKKNEVARKKKEKNEKSSMTISTHK